MKSKKVTAITAVSAILLLGVVIYTLAINGTFKASSKEKATESKSTVKSVTEAISEETASVVGEMSAFTTADSESTTAEVDDAMNTYEYSESFNPVVADMNAEWDMILINRNYILPNGYVPQLAPSITADANSYQLDYRVAPHYNEMYLAAKKDGIILTPVSGYRSYEKQKTNFENKIQYYVNQGKNRLVAIQEAAKIILPPGTSEHNLGLAMDICSLEQSFENTNEFKWLQEHAEEYGFILRYPKDKQDITKIIYEPWHWRYVGVENAKKINASGKCLEEYLGKVGPANS